MAPSTDRDLNLRRADATPREEGSKTNRRKCSRLGQAHVQHDQRARGLRRAAARVLGASRASSRGWTPTTSTTPYALGRRRGRLRG